MKRRCGMNWALGILVGNLLIVAVALEMGNAFAWKWKQRFFSCSGWIRR